MKRLILPLLLIAAAIPAAAQDVPGEEPGPVVLGARHMVIEFLELDEFQIDAWDILWEDHLLAEEPIKEQIVEVQAAIEDQFAGGAPDPETLGLLMIDRRALGEDLIAVHVFYVEGFQALLDEEQAQRLHQIRIAERIAKFVPAFKVFELVRR